MIEERSGGLTSRVGPRTGAAAHRGRRVNLNPRRGRCILVCLVAAPCPSQTRPRASAARPREHRRVTYRPVQRQAITESTEPLYSDCITGRAAAAAAATWRALARLIDTAASHGACSSLEAALLLCQGQLQGAHGCHPATSPGARPRYQRAEESETTPLRYWG